MRRVHSVAYIRRSARSRTDPGDLSREFQIEKVRELAGADGATLRIIDTDWGRSAATDKTDKRIASLALLEEVERGEVAVLYAYATDRLARSVEWSARLLNACRRAGTIIVTGEGRFEPDNALTDQLFYFAAMQNEGYSRQAQQKRNATVARQRARGDKLGPSFYGSKPGESIAAVLAAFDEAGSAHGAAVLLNKRGIPTRRGGSWTHASARQILMREGRIPRYGTRGAKPHAPFAFYRLLRCHCGKMLSGARVTHQRGKPTPPRVLYRCINGSTDPEHGVKSIAESKILPAAMAEAARLRLPDAVETTTADRERTDLEAKRERIVDMYADGTIRDKAERDRRLAAVDDALSALDEKVIAFEVPAIDWSWTPEAINSVLRALWRRIDVGPDLRPLADGFAWRVPEWRA